MKTTKIIIFFLLAALLVTSGFKCGGPPAGLTLGKPQPVTLEYWKVFEESSDVQDLISAYQKEHPHIVINYRNFTYDEYEKQLVRALAEDRGPDIFSINTTWMREYQSLISPLPATVTIAYQVTKGTIKKETYTEMRTKKTLTLRDVKALFPDVIYDNQVINDQIYGLPLSIDTLALYYNRDLLNNAGISNPPTNWDEFREDVIKLTKQDSKGNIIQSGAAIGTATNVARSPDIISLLMMQNGTPMTDSNGYATFNQKPTGYQRELPPAAEALNFYNGFASPATQSYTWNENLPNSLESFMSGKTAFFFGYAYNLSTIKARAPKLNFEIAKMPQVGTPINFANYWTETVSKKSKNQNEAWDFIIFMTTNEEMNKTYLQKSRLPIALRNLIITQTDDLELAPFADQILTSRSWYKGKDAEASDKILEEMISGNLEGILKTNEIVSLAVQKINQTYK
ncbi:extracellular solute-binding protein [Candidatus Falkowbacteria bacterium]|nr:extracellular solute-binding protein [Candidatus Falkowbacteria bacterium]